MSFSSFAAAAVLMLLAAYGLLLARLSQGPIALDNLTPKVVEALQERFGAGYQFELKQASLVRSAEGFSLALEGMSVRDSSGHPVVQSPSARLSVDPMSLATGNLTPRRLEIRDADLRLSILPDGQLAISAGARGQPAIPLAEAVPGLSPEEPRVAASPAVPGEASAEAAHAARAAQPVDRLADFDRASAALLALYELAVRADSPLGAMDRLGLTHGRLAIEDVNTHRDIVFDGLDLAIERTDGITRLSMAVDGPSGRWKAALRAGADAQRQRSLNFEFDDLSLDDIALLAGQRATGFVLDTPITLQMEVVLDGAGKISGGKGRVALGAGIFKPDDKDSEPILVDELTGDLAIDPVRHAILLTNWQYYSGETHFVVDGAVLPPQPERPVWNFDLATRSGGVVGPERPGELALVIDRIAVTGSAAPDEARLALDKLTVAGPGIDLEFSLESQGGANPRLQLAGLAKNASLTSLVRLWPSNVAAPVRAWSLQHILAGTVDRGSVALDFDSSALDMIARDIPVPDEALHLEMNLAGGAFNVLPGVPPISGLSASLLVSGRKASLSARQGHIEISPGRRLELSEGTLTVPDTKPKPAPASISAHVSGSLETVSAILATESLKPFVNLPLDPALVRGQIDGRLTLDMKLGKPSLPEETQVKVTATLSNFTAEKLIGKEKLDAATLTLNFDRSGVKASGQGKMFGQPATIDLKKTASEAGEAIITFALDEAARTRLGVGGTGVSGPVNARVTSKLGLVEATQAQVDLDFGKAGMEGILPGFSKAAGKPAKASFQAVGDSDGLELKQFAFDGGGASLRGSITLGAEGGFASAKFSQFKLSASDDVHADVTKAGDGLKLLVRGNSLDARPFLQNIFANGPDGGKDTELDLKVGQLIGQNRQVLTAAELKVTRKGGAARQFQMSGKFGPAAVSGAMAAGGQINLKSDNAGSLLAFVDFYKRMEGGEMTLTLHLANGRADGSVLIHDFLLRDEPALRRLVSEGATVRDDAVPGQQSRFDPGLVAFQKLQVGFVKTGGRIDLQDGVMYGPQIGTSLEGTVDFPKNFVDVKGTFVPAYGLNNFFARIPVIGVLLGGGTHEGLFAVNFRISGPASGPTLNINPLSAIAPGFLRKIFGAGDIPAGFQTNSVR